jgi:hypothetical protein
MPNVARNLLFAGGVMGGTGERGELAGLVTSFKQGRPLRGHQRGLGGGADAGGVSGPWATA